MSRRRLQITDDNWVRKNLAMLITIISVVGIIILTWIAISFIFKEMLPKLTGGENGFPKDAFSMLQTVLGFILPLIGTWMGTILAFYFSRENFEAASKSVTDIFSNVASSASSAFSGSQNALEASIKFGEIEFNKTIVNKPDSEIKVISDIYNFIQTNKKGERLPIFNSSQIVRYVIHLSVINDFLTQFDNKKFPDLIQIKKDELTLSDMLNKSSNNISNIISNSVGFVSKASTLAEVQTLMKNNKFSQDIFITQNGKKDEPVLGWVTNSQLIELSKS